MTHATGDDLIVVLRSAVAGDEIAFARIVAAYHEDMRRVCVVVCGDEGVAEEAVHAAWAIAWRRMGAVRDAEQLRPWLVSVAVNEARQLLRRDRRRAIREVAVERSRDSGGARDPAAGIGALDLRNAMARLDPEDRALLAMRYVAGFDSTELAKATGLTPSGTRARLRRLLQRLERELIDG